MKIYIPSRGRPDARRTQRSLDGCWPRKDIVTVVDKVEYNAYRKAMPNDEILVYGGKRGIGNVRQWILEWHESEQKDRRLIMMDDDLRFMYRRDDDHTKAVKITKEQTTEMLSEVGAQLFDRLHGSVLPRQGANTMPNVPVAYNRRLLRVLAYNARRVLGAGIQFNRVQFMEDFDVTLQLLEVGHQNFTLCSWWQDQYVSNAEGGCSTYRTGAAQAQAAHTLHQLHPDFVTVVEKPAPKVSWEGIGTRTDVRIQWKKAYRSNV